MICTEKSLALGQEAISGGGGGGKEKGGGWGGPWTGQCRRYHLSIRDFYMEAGTIFSAFLLKVGLKNVLQNIVLYVKPALKRAFYFWDQRYWRLIDQDASVLCDIREVILKIIMTL